MMHFTHGPINWWGFGPGMILMIAFWVLIIVGFVALVRGLLTQNNSSEQDSALEILRRRYAEGEVSQEEFEKKKNTLNNN